MGHAGSSPLPSGEGFYSQYFIIPKAKGCLKSILDLQNLNQFKKRKKKKKKKKKKRYGYAILDYSDLSPNDRFGALVSRDACFHVAVRQSHKKFLRFVIEEIHQFMDLLLGLSSAPRVLKKCTTVMAAHF